MMAQDIRICFVGDSFVHGVGDERATGWVGRLCVAVAGARVTCYNLGVRRDTSSDVLRRWQSECVSRLTETSDGRLVFSFGVNDTAIENGQTRVALDRSRENLHVILQAARRWRRLFVGPPPVEDVMHNTRIAVLSEVFAAECREQAVPYIDLYTPLHLDNGYLQEIGDGAHPRGRGYEKIADLIAANAAWWFRGVGTSAP